MDGLFDSVEGYNSMEVAESFVGCEVLKSEKELYFDSETSWFGAEKNSAPWWRTADTDELASFVAKRSLDYIENCDLPRPQNIRVNEKDGDFNTCCFSTHSHTLESPSEGHLVSSAVNSSRDVLTHEPLPETHRSDPNSPTKAKLMEALHHSQTRAREAERAAQQARADKEHVAKLVFGQASHLFAYKQWLKLLQLENMCLHFVNSKSLSVSIVFPVMSSQTTGETEKTRLKSSSSREKRARAEYDVGKYAVVLAIGLGLIGAGFLLGWTVGRIFPTW